MKVSNVSVSRRAGRPQAGQSTCFQVGCRSSGLPACLEVDLLGQRHRQLVARDRHDPALAAMDDRDRAAPVALARDAPVAQAVGGLAATAAQALQLRDGTPLAGLDVEAVQEGRVEQGALADIGLRADLEAGGVGAGGQDDGDDRPAVLAGELEVALVVRRAAEDGAGAVVHQHEVGDVDRQGQVGEERVPGGQAGVVALLLLGLELGSAGAALQALGDEGRQPLILAGEPGGQRVIGGDGQEGGAEERVGPGGEDLELLLAADQIEAHPGTDRAADPVALHQPDLLGPALQPVEGGQQLVGIGRGAEEPLRQLAPLDQGPRAPAAAVDHLLVGEHGLVDRVPVDPALLAVDEAALEHVEEHGLLVAVVAGIAGGDLARPVERQPHALELVAHLGDVGVGPGRRVDALLHRGVLGRQAESIPAHRMQHVEALGPLHPGQHVAHGVVADMAHVDAPRRIGEHLQDVVFRARRIGLGAEHAALRPDLLPLRLGGAEGVSGHALTKPCEGTGVRRRPGRSLRR